MIARQALDSEEARRLMTVPGVNVITAATFLAAIGDIRRFRSPRKLVGYLGLDPKVRQSGPGPATHGRVSKQGSAPARYALVEAAWSVVRQPGPLHAFYERIRARRPTRSRSSPPHASSRSCSGTCSRRQRTTHTHSRRSRARSCAGWSCSRVPRGTGVSPVSGPPTRRCAKRSASSPSRPSAPMSAASATGNRRRARARHGDAHLQGRLAASSAARHRSQTLRFSSSSLAPTATLPERRASVQRA